MLLVQLIVVLGQCLGDLDVFSFDNAKKCPEEMWRSFIVYDSA